jgi:hypothetical protein
MIQYDVYQPNNVLIILISSNSIHKIYLLQHPLLFLLSKKEPSDTINVFNDHVRYIFFFLFDASIQKDIYIFFNFLFFVTRRYDVKNNESVQRMIHTQKKLLSQKKYIRMLLLLFHTFFFYYIEI